MKRHFLAALLAVAATLFLTPANASIIFQLTLTAPETGMSGTGILKLQDGTDLSGGNYTPLASPVELLTFSIGSFPTIDLTNSYTSISFLAGNLTGIQTSFGNFPANWPVGPTYSGSSNGLQYMFLDWITSVQTNSGVITAERVIAPAVPEASTWAMLIVGFAGVGLVAYRRRGQRTALRTA